MGNNTVEEKNINCNNYYIIIIELTAYIIGK